MIEYWVLTDNKSRDNISTLNKPRTQRYKGLNNMSAFVVPDNHFLAIVSRAVKNMPDYCRGNYTFVNGQEVIEFGTTAGNLRIANILKEENVIAVNIRYPDMQETFVPIARFRKVEKIEDAVEMFKAIESLDYQSCEDNNWKNTFAYEILQVFITWTVRSMTGYESAEWVIN
jgi:hypothetical protein